MLRRHEQRFGEKRGGVFISLPALFPCFAAERHCFGPIGVRRLIVGLVRRYQRRRSSDQVWDRTLLRKCFAGQVETLRPPANRNVNVAEAAKRSVEIGCFFQDLFIQSYRRLVVAFVHCLGRRDKL
jgi:hypothetical protein